MPVKIKVFTLLWVSPLVRSSYKQQRQDDALSIQFSSLGIPSSEGDLFDLIRNAKKASVDSINPSFIADMNKYQDTQDVVLLEKMFSMDNSLQRIIDEHTKQAFMLVHNNRGELVMVGNLNPLDVSSVNRVSSNQLSHDIINKYVVTRTASLLIE